MQLNGKMAIRNCLILLFFTLMMIQGCKPMNKSEKSVNAEIYRLNSTKYRIGMAMDEALKIIPGTPEVEAAALAPKSASGFSEEEKQSEPMYLIRVADEGVNLEFNYYKKLINITSVKQVKKAMVTMDPSGRVSTNE